LDGQQHPALVTPATYLIDLRTLAQAAATTFSRQESALGSLMLWNTSRAA
jgi:hypothetical protein